MAGRQDVAGGNGKMGTSNKCAVKKIGGGSCFKNNGNWVFRAKIKFRGVGGIYSP